MIKKLLNLFVTILACCMLCSCTAKDSRTIVQFASWGSKSEIDIIKPLLSEFEERNSDIKVDFMHIPQNYFHKIHLLFASNTPPDVIFINNLYLPIYANAGVLESISDWKDLEQYDSNILKSLSYNGLLFAIPRDVSNMVIYYNKDLFDKYDLEYPDNNWTFRDLLNYAQILTQDGNFGISFEEDSLYFLPYLMSEGGGIVSDDLKTIIINDENSIRGLKFYSDLRNKYHVAPKAEESASATMAQMFLQGKIAMHLSGRWLVPKYREEAKFNWDVAQFPNGSMGSIVPLDASGWAISKGSKNKNEARRLIEFLSSKENIEKITTAGLIVPARNDAAHSKSFLDRKSPKHAEVFLNAIKTAKPTPVPVNYSEILDNIRPQLEREFN